MTETTERTLELSPGLQRLIDERLDGIERALRGAGLPRGERVQVLEDVERQLLDMLTETGLQPSRRDVLQALAKLDPPEAYLSDEPRAVRSEDAIPAETRATSGAPFSRWALASGAGLAFTGFLILAAVMGVFANNEFIIYSALFLGACAALATAVVGGYALMALRHDKLRGTGVAAAALVVAAWFLAVVLSYLGAIMFESEIMLYVLLVIKDVPFGMALIWCLRAVIKSLLPRDGRAIGLTVALGNH